MLSLAVTDRGQLPLLALADLPRFGILTDLRVCMVWSKGRLHPDHVQTWKSDGIRKYPPSQAPPSWTSPHSLLEHITPLGNSWASEPQKRSP